MQNVIKTDITASTIKWHLDHDNNIQLSHFCDKWQVDRRTSGYYQHEGIKGSYYLMTTYFSNGGFIVAELQQGSSINETYKVLDHSLDGQPQVVSSVTRIDAVVPRPHENIDSPIKRTEEYAKFRELRDSRIASQAAINRYLDQFKRPILVTPDFEIIEGKHWFFILKALRQPIYYIVVTGK